jgi:hypothetical protein
MGAVAHLESRLVQVAPGSQAAAQIRVRNSGSVVDQFTFQVLGDAAAWSTVAPLTLSLFPGAEEVATITFAPPRAATVPAGQMPFGVHVISKEDPQGSVVEEGALDIAPFSDVFAELAPRTSRGSRGASHDLAIDNRGNAPINATVTATDQDRLLNFDVRPPGVMAQPGTATFAKVAVRPKQRFWRGPAKTRPFQVLLDGAGPTPMTVDGTLVQESILPPWILRALLLLAAAIIALILLWFLLVKPAVESTALQQTNQALQAAGIQPASNPNQPPPGGGAGPSQAPGTSPAASGVVVSSAPPLLGGGRPTDATIKAGSSVTVPAGTTLFVTDLIFSNSNDQASGPLQLTRSNDPVITLQLENFRDIDYHFVTPIVFTAGQQLGLDCGPGSANCSDQTVYYSGYLR